MICTIVIFDLHWGSINQKVQHFFNVVIRSIIGLVIKSISFMTHKKQD